MGIQLTGNYDTDLKILNVLDDATVINLCQTSQYTEQLCDDKFWRQKYIDRFGPKMLEHKPDDLSFKQYYYHRRLKPYSRYDLLDTVFSAGMRGDTEYLDVVRVLHPQLNHQIADGVVIEYIEGSPERGYRMMEWGLNRNDIATEMLNVGRTDELLNDVANKGDVITFIELTSRLPSFDKDDADELVMISELIENRLHLHLEYPEMGYLTELNMLVEKGLTYPEDIMFIIHEVDPHLADPKIKQLWDFYQDQGYHIDLGF